MLFPRSLSPTPAPRVVVTGAGIVTALGLGWSVNSLGFRTGRHAFGPISVFDATRQRTRLAAEVALPPTLPGSRLTPRQELRLDRAGRLLVHAAAEAWHQAGWDSGPAFRDSTAPLPLVLGTTSGGMNCGLEFFRQLTGGPTTRPGQPTRVSEYQPQHQALTLMNAFGFRGPTTIIANACASGANAVGRAFTLIRTGQAERVLAGGYDGLSELVYAGFDTLQALSPTTCRPFAARRDGLALGEGAALLTLESLASAQRRGATILGEIAGYGAVTDTHHLTQPQPNGDAALASMQAACQQAGVGPPEIDYLNAHGTGTPLNDQAEAAAINRWTSGHEGRVPVSSTKASIGHLLGAAGAVETVVCLMALVGQWLPPQLDTGPLDPACHFPVVTAPTNGTLTHALTNSFGFGGANASLVLRRWPS